MDAAADAVLATDEAMKVRSGTDVDVKRRAAKAASSFWSELNEFRAARIFTMLAILKVMTVAN